MPDRSNQPALKLAAAGGGTRSALGAAHEQLNLTQLNLTPFLSVSVLPGLAVLVPVPVQDPNAPKRATTAYFVYQADNRAVSEPWGLRRQRRRAC